MGLSSVSHQRVGLGWFLLPEACMIQETWAKIFHIWFIKVTSEMLLSSPRGPLERVRHYFCSLDPELVAENLLALITHKSLYLRTLQPLLASPSQGV